MLDTGEWLPLALAGLVGALIGWIKAQLGRRTASLEREHVKETLETIRLRVELAQAEREAATQIGALTSQKTDAVRALLEETHQAVNSGRERLEESLVSQREAFEARIAVLEQHIQQAAVRSAKAEGLAEGQQGAGPDAVASVTIVTDKESS